MQESINKYWLDHGVYIRDDIHNPADEHEQTIEYEWESITTRYKGTKQVITTKLTSKELIYYMINAWNRNGANWKYTLLCIL